MNRNRLAALSICAAVPAALCGLSDYFLRIAADRQPPASLQLLANVLQGLKKGEDPYAGLEPGWERLRGMPHERVEISAADGVRLVGHWFEAENARRVLIAVHGWRSRWYRDFGASFDFYRENGCSVLYIELRGQGESGGEQICFGLKERLDLPLWADWAAARAPGLPLYLAGISMGAATVMMAADLHYPESLRGLMADCGYTSVEGIWRHVVQENLHLSYALLRPFVRSLFRRRTGLAPDACDAEKTLAACSLPVLLIHGEADAFVPCEDAQAAFRACGGRAQLMTVPGAGHGLSYIEDKEGYERALLDFWSRCEAEAPQA